MNRHGFEKLFAIVLLDHLTNLYSLLIFKTNDEVCDILLYLDITLLDILLYLVDLAPEGHKVAVRHLNALETDIAII